VTHPAAQYCSECGSEWGGYSTHEEQHYCHGGVRKFRRIPSHSQREDHAALRRDPYYARQEDQAAFYKRHR